MTIAKIVEISAESSTSFEDAIREGIDRASKTLDQVKGAWVKDQQVLIADGKVTGFRVTMKVTFVMK
ncbi:MAG: dodecin family protein [Sandaracinaceae bacterium]